MLGEWLGGRNGSRLLHANGHVHSCALRQCA
jgi:hypothetical protein